jgi:hypothetical protein
VKIEALKSPKYAVNAAQTIDDIISRFTKSPNDPTVETNRVPETFNVTLYIRRQWTDSADVDLPEAFQVSCQCPFNSHSR